MNRIYTLLIAAVCTLSASAQLTGDGYYRAQSSEQQRYINVMDNRGSVNLATTDADMGALCTRLGFENIVSDPASIIYIKKMNTGYDFQTQGTSTYSIISYEIKLSDMGDNKYWCSASHAGMTKYLADELILEYMATEEEKQMREGNIEQNVVSLAREHPETTFIYFFPPYSSFARYLAVSIMRLGGFSNANGLRRRFSSRADRNRQRPKSPFLISWGVRSSSSSSGTPVPNSVRCGLEMICDWPVELAFFRNV